MDTNRHTNYTEVEGEAFRRIRDLTEEDSEEVTEFLVDNQLNLNFKDLNNT